MLIKRNLGRIGGLVAALSLLFLPLASCGEDQAGLGVIDIFFYGDRGEIGILFIALTAAVLATILVQHRAQLILGATGLAAFTIEYFSINEPESTIQLREGAYLAGLGFLLTFLAGWLGPRISGSGPPKK